MGVPPYINQLTPHPFPRIYFNPSAHSFSYGIFYLFTAANMYWQLTSFQPSILSAQLFSSHSVLDLLDCPLHPQGADSLPPPLSAAKAGKKSFERIKTTLLPTGIGERYSLSISNLCQAEFLCRCELPLKTKILNWLSGPYIVKSLLWGCISINQFFYHLWSIFKEILQKSRDSVGRSYSLKKYRTGDSDLSSSLCFNHLT